MVQESLTNALKHAGRGKVEDEWVTATGLPTRPRADDQPSAHEQPEARP